jgi:uncharacterized Tic20 family protein
MSETPQYQYQPVPPMSDSDQRLWATLVHVGGIFFGFLPALIGYLVAKDRGWFIREHTRTALNFQITMILAAIVGAILIFVAIGIFVIIGVDLAIIICSIMAAIAANNGQSYRYPFTIEFVK